jgi:hypothetical protein
MKFNIAHSTNYLLLNSCDNTNIWKFMFPCHFSPCKWFMILRMDKRAPR